MYVVKNSPRALLVALIRLAVVHAVLTAMALLGAKAAEPANLPTLDHVVVLYLTRLVMDGALLFAGHSILSVRLIMISFDFKLLRGAA